MTNTTQNDLSLLRAFDLEAAKAGDLLCDVNDSNTYKLIDALVSTKTGEVSCCEVEEIHYKHNYSGTTTEYLRMKPICWVEGKPVYKGDVLYGKKCTTLKYIANFIKHNNILYTEDNETQSYCEAIENLTWNKPKQKVKRKFWINVYPEVYGGSSIWGTKEEAESVYTSERIACVETEIEYEV